jgi:hypothetical protein
MAAGVRPKPAHVTRAAQETRNHMTNQEPQRGQTQTEGPKWTHVRVTLERLYYPKPTSRRRKRESWTLLARVANDAGMLVSRAILDAFTRAGVPHTEWSILLTSLAA